MNNKLQAHLSESIQSISEMFDREDYIEAINLSKQLVVEVQRRDGSQSLLVWEAFLNHSILHLKLGDYAVAEHFLRRAQEICAANAGEDSFEFGKTIFIKGQLRMSTGPLKEARSNFQSASQIMKASIGQHSYIKDCEKAISDIDSAMGSLGLDDSAVMLTQLQLDNVLPKLLANAAEEAGEIYRMVELTDELREKLESAEIIETPLERSERLKNSSNKRDT